VLDAADVVGYLDERPKKDGMPDVIELRVHGVGGSPAEGLLGVADPADCVQVAGQGETTFVARRDDLRAQGYLWGALTEKPLLQPLWLFLLPFTLVNVAGWMHGPLDEVRGGRAVWLRAFRFLVLVTGVAFTASTFLWIANVVINRLYRGQTPLRFAWDPKARILLGGFALLLIVGLIWLVAGWRQRGFEGFMPEDDPVEGAPAVEGAFSRVPDASLSDPRFWGRPSYGMWLLTAHTAVAVGATVAVTAWSWIKASAHDLPNPTTNPAPGRGLHALGIAGLATYATELALWAIVALTIVHLVGWRRRPRGARRFRWLGPTTAAASGVAYGTIVIYGIPLLLGARSFGRVAVIPSSFGIGTIGFLASVVALAVMFVVARGRAHRTVRAAPPPVGVPPNPPGRDGDEPRGATPAMYARIATSRTLSEAGTYATTALTVSSLAFVAAALYQFRFGQVGGLGWTVRLGELVAIAGTGSLLFFLIRNARKPNERRIVGILWDVLTFWPRRFHPFGVRPYSERAVPELQTRIARLVRHDGRRVMLSTHSQGTVIGYAALVQLPDEVLNGVAFVTYGSPLRQLYEMAFPAFFSRAAYDELRSRLFDDGGAPSPSWRSFYRLTDYVGKTVFEDPALEAPVPDPAVQPVVGETPLDRPFLPAYPDMPRIAWSDLLLHSFYNREVVLKAWIRELRVRMRAAPPPAPPGSTPSEV
jgi:hypothetical protein